MKRSQVAEMVLMLLASYPGAKTIAKTSEVYETLLADLDYAVARKAVTRLIATSKWLPTIAEIREACTALTHGPVRTGGEAFQIARTAVDRIGRYGAVRFRDPLVTETLRMWGSWQGFCNSPEDDPGGRARFIELYEQLAARARADVVSGIALPAPRTELRIGPRPIVKAELRDPVPAQIATAPVVALVLPTPTPRPPSAYAGRKLSAEEIDAAMGAA